MPSQISTMAAIRITNLKCWHKHVQCSCLFLFYSLSSLLPFFPLTWMSRSIHHSEMNKWFSMHYLPSGEASVESLVRFCHHPEKTSISLTETANNAETDMPVYVSVLHDKLWPSVHSVQPLKLTEIFISQWPIPVANSQMENVKWISVNITSKMQYNVHFCLSLMMFVVDATKNLIL